jgi:hypothetical protein
MLASEGTPTTADIPGASGTSNMSRDASNSRVVSNRREVSNSRHNRNITEQATVAT